MAKNTENEIAAARDDRYPFVSPLKNRQATVYNGIPSNPGRMILFDRPMIEFTGFNAMNQLVNCSGEAISLLYWFTKH